MRGAEFRRAYLGTLSFCTVKLHTFLTVARLTDEWPEGNGRNHEAVRIRVRRNSQAEYFASKKRVRACNNSCGLLQVSLPFSCFCLR